MNLVSILSKYRALAATIGVGASAAEILKNGLTVQRLRYGESGNFNKQPIN